MIQGLYSPLGSFLLPFVCATPLRLAWEREHVTDQSPSTNVGRPRHHGRRHGATTRAWLLAGPSVGLAGGAIVGVVEPVIRLAPQRHQMTIPLWVETMGFSVVSHGVAWVTVCIVACLLGLLATRSAKWWRVRLRPSPTAWAGLVVGVTVVTIWGRAGGQPTQLGRLYGLAGASVAAVILLCLAALIFTRFGATRPGSWVFRGARLAVWPTVPIALIALVVQWRGRSRVESAEGFWPPTTSRPAHRASGRPPDVILVVLDTLRADRLGCYGYDRPTSPHIDAFASDAVRFDMAFSPSPWTAPAHASIFTGLFRSQHGMHWDHLWLDDRFVTLAEALRERGYQTVALSNNDFVSTNTNLTQGFDRVAMPTWLGFAKQNALYRFVRLVWKRTEALGPLLGRWFLHDAGGPATTLLVDDVLDRRDPARPLFLFINYMEPHQPYEPTRAYRRAFVRPEDLARSYEIDQGSEATCRYIFGLDPPQTERDLGILSALYDARVRELDDHFADLIRLLQAETDLDNVLVVVTSDHGEHLGDHRLLGHQFSVYNALIRVPLIVRCPRLLRPQRVDRPVQTHDVFPTLLAWTETAAAQTAEVIVPSLATALSTSTQPARRRVVAEYLNPPGWVLNAAQQQYPAFDFSFWKVAATAIIEEGRKFVLRSDRRVALYDLSTDPEEQHNVAAAHPEQVARLRQSLVEWRDSFAPYTSDGSDVRTGHRLTEEQMQRLRDLGYVR